MRFEDRMHSSRLLTSVDGLIAAGLAEPTRRATLEAIERHYAIAITPTMQALIDRPDDPLGRQFVPDPAELVTAAHERADPIDDDRLSPVPGIVHRYADRALLKPLLVCPVYCRFCFRREHVGPNGGLLGEAALQTALDWLAAHEQVGEVIITGGDPLMLSPRRLSRIVRALDAMAHVHTIRLHSRVPLADPARLDTALLDSLEAETPVWLVVHANSAPEFTAEGRAALDRLRRRGLPLLGQSVLLAGVNDSVVQLEALLRAMLAARVKPYYLHQLDATPGTSHFHVPVARGQALLRALRGRVTGLAWPTYVLDIPGGHGKVPIGPEYLDGLAVIDPSGAAHPLAEAGRTD